MSGDDGDLLAGSQLVGLQGVAEKGSKVQKQRGTVGTERGALLRF